MTRRVDIRIDRIEVDPGQAASPAELAAAIRREIARRLAAPQALEGARPGRDHHVDGGSTGSSAAEIGSGVGAAVHRSLRS